MPRRGIGIVLTGVAGFVDAIGYIVLAHVFVANMSGNSIAVGLHGADLRWSEVGHRGYPILMFVGGLLLGGALTEAGRRHRPPRFRLAAALLFEAILLAAFLTVGITVLGWRGRPRTATVPEELVLVALSALAMGVQNVSLRASGLLNVYTTHVTGSLTQLADEAVQYGYWVRDHVRRRAAPLLARWRRLIRASPRHPSFSEMFYLLGCWCAYVGGAAAGAFGLVRWGFVAAVVPPLVLGLLAALELTSPALHRGSKT